MARTKAISLIQNGATKVELAELSGLVIANIQKETLSSGLKSQSYTGNPASGSVEYKRFKNSASQAYGTARTAGKGTALTVPPDYRQPGHPPRDRGGSREVRPGHLRRR